MFDDSSAEERKFVGVTKKADGSPDFSSAALVAGKDGTRTAIRQDRFQRVLGAVQSSGLDENTIRFLIQTLTVNDRPIRKRAIVTGFARERGLTDV